MGIVLSEGTKGQARLDEILRQPDMIGKMILSENPIVEKVFRADYENARIEEYGS